MQEYVYDNIIAEYTIMDGIYKPKIKPWLSIMANGIYPLLIRVLAEARCPQKFELVKYMVKILETLGDQNFMDFRVLNYNIKGGDNGLDRDKVIMILAEYFIFKLFNLEELYPIIADKLINEIYIDRANINIYVDHALFGRLDTRVSLQPKQLEDLILLIKFVGDTVITGLNPSAKVNMYFAGQVLRVSVDMHRDGNSSVVIRKLTAIPPFLSFLIDDDMRKILAIIVTLLVLRPNVIIFGETGSGKTTLASLVLGVVPSFWRLVIIEDVAEIPEDVLADKRACRIIVPPYELRVSASGLTNVNFKEQEILKLLHRSPDYCFVSEIQDLKDTQALFHAYSAGIRGIATTHARSISGLLNRWIGTYRIPVEWLDLVDIIVFMRKRVSSKKMMRFIEALHIPLDLNLDEQMEQQHNISSAYEYQKNFRRVVFSGDERRVILMEIAKSDISNGSREILKGIFSAIIGRMSNRALLKTPNKILPLLLKIYKNVYESLTILGNVLKRGPVEREKILKGLGRISRYLADQMEQITSLI